MKSDAELVDLCIAGDASAFGVLVRRHERTVHAISFYILRDHHDAQDLTQDAFVTAYRSLPRLRDREAFGPWVATIARRLALDAARKNSTMKLAGAEGLSRAGELSAESADLDIDSERLMAVVLALPMRERQVVLLRHFDGHDVQTIAQISGESVGTITKRLSRAHARLKEQLEGKNP